MDLNKLSYIREKGGAYGSGAKQEDGIFTFMSYRYCSISLLKFYKFLRFFSAFRDPNSFDTLNVFTKCIEWASEGGFTEKDVEEAKLSVFSLVS